MVEVFQTNIQNGETADALLKALQPLFPKYRMNFDLEDCDNILRVESTTAAVDATLIIGVVQSYGHLISILPDMVPKDIGIFDR